MPRFPFQHVTPPGTWRALLFLCALAAFCCLSVVLHPPPLIGATTAAVEAPMSIVTTGSNVIWDDAALRLICLAGSIGGAMLSVLLFPPTTARAMAGKICASVISGAMFTPPLIRWIDVVPDADLLLCGAGVVSLMSWSLLMAAIPLVQRAAKKWLNLKLDNNDDNESDTPTKP